MKAVTYKKANGLVFEEIEMPIPAEDQVLIRVANTGFCGSDHSLVESGSLEEGMILGHETSGIVEKVGNAVEIDLLDKKVIIRPTFCGECSACRIDRPQLCNNNRRSIGIGDLQGGFAEYLVAYPDMLIPIPENVDSQNAALAEAFAVGLHAVNLTKRKSGSSLVLGAGAIGLALIKVLKIIGFSPIIVSEPSWQKRQLATFFGADVVIDPKEENLPERIFEITNAGMCEVVFECAGVPALLPAAMNVAAVGGTVCQLSVMYQDIAFNPAVMMFKEIQLLSSYGNTHDENKQCLEWMSEGILDAKPLISDLITLSELPRVYKEVIHTGKATKVMLQIGEEF